MNKIWWYIMFFGTLALLFVNPGDFLSCMTKASVDCVTLCLELFAVYAIWLGLLEILDASGLSERLAKLLTPLVKKLFKTDDPQAIKLISVTLSANFLGLGNAATPSGISAMQRLDDKSGKINYPMIMLMILSSCSIQFLPTTIMGLRSTYGSTNPADIIVPILLSSIVATSSGVLLGILYGKIKRRKNLKNNENC